MEMLIVTTDSHQVLLNECFRTSLPPDAGVTLRQKHLSVAGGGEFESASWQTGVGAKLAAALEYTSSVPPNTIFAQSDVDIQFFRGFSASGLAAVLGAAGVDVLFQKEHRSANSFEVNTGFFVARATPWVVDLLEKAAALVEDQDVKKDQDAVNQLLDRADLGLHYGFLPFEYYARSQGFPPQRDILLHHANLSGSVPSKIKQMRRVRRYVTGGPLQRASSLVEEGIDQISPGKARQRARNILHAVRKG